MEVKKTALRNEIADTDKWNLSELYASLSEWENDYKRVADKIDQFDKFAGKLATSLETFKECICFDLEMSRTIEKVYVYAHLCNDQDKTDNKGEELYQRAVSLYTKLSEKTSFIVPEIQSIDDSTMKGYLDSDDLADYRFYLEKTLRYKPHTLSKEVEELFAMSGEVLSAPGKIFSQLDNADLSFGTMENSSGELVELSHGNFVTFLTDPDRDTRRKAFFQYYKAYEDHKYTLATTLSSSMKRDWLSAKVRKYDSCRSASLFKDDVSHSVYDNLISSVKARSNSIVKYMDIRKKALDIETAHFYDTYVPLVAEVEFTMSYEEAALTCVEALAPLGEDYCSILKEGLLGGWVDRYENRGKRSGAYSSGCYDSWPYILMNYESANINSLYTLIHEAGHSMHSYFSKNTQPYHYADYTIFVAEVASTFNETLLTDFLLKKYADDPLMKAYIINREIDNIRGTLFRQTMFAEFEHLMHSAVENDVPLTVDSITAEYRKLLETYFAGSIKIDKELELECFRIPHFYSAFYVYKYATGISAAISLAEDVLSGKGGAKDAYRTFLTLGGSKFPIEELKIAGVDMSGSEPVEKALNRFDEQLERLKGLLS